MYQTSIEDAKNNIKEKKERKPRKKTQSELFDIKKNKLSESDKKKLKEHSKDFKNGMKSSHIKNMMKFMKEGNSFSVSHRKAVQLDKGK